jgi:ubiquinone/menaquinone biosynthesis C-methylase UbiE
MITTTSPNRWLQFATAAIIAIFVLGFVFSSLGAWTGPVLGAWFIGTQKPWRGFLLLAGIGLILNFLSNWRGFLLTGIAHAGWMLLAILIGALPFLLYRLISQRRPGFLSTLSLPFWGVALLALGQLWPRLIPAHRTVAISFLIYWLAAVMVWMWNQEFRARKIATGASIFGAVCILLLGYSLFPQIHPAAAHAPLANLTIGWICLVGALILAAWSLIQPGKPRQLWADKTGTVALLRSPYSGDSLHVVSEAGHEVLLSQKGERFSVRNGIPVFLGPEKLTGLNQKYNRLYEIIGGFYDDTQKVACALHGVSRDQYFRDYLRFLEIRPGDSVLETSVGTGLNFKYLPRGIRLFGLDLSPEMLTNCQANLRRWELDADLFLGNAEDLPFANDSFDVVFHVGGINFFSDRAKAILEMIRVAKPGSRILIADETEEHVKSAYERIPVTSQFFKNRKEPVTAPIDLVPPEMREINLELLHGGRFYALTFRKPATAAPNPASSHSLR